MMRTQQSLARGSNQILTMKPLKGFEPLMDWGKLQYAHGRATLEGNYKTNEKLSSNFKLVLVSFPIDVMTFFRSFRLRK